MDNEKGFFHAFGFCGTYLSLVGLWPSLKSSKTNDILSLLRFTIIVVSLLTFNNMAQTVKLISVWGDLDAMTEIISTSNLPVAVVVFKMFVFLSHKKDMKTLILFAMKDWCKSLSTKEAEIMWYNAKITRKMSIVCTFLGVGTVSGHLLMRICQELGYVPSREKRQPLLTSSFPFDYKPSPIYEFTWFMQYISPTFGTFAYTGTYCLFVALMLHLCGQFANLRERIEGLVTNNKTPDQYHASIVEIVERHDSLNRFADVIENTYNSMFLAEILSCTIQFCLQGFLLVTLTFGEGAGVPIFHLLFMTVYIMHVGTHLFLCCYVSDKLQDEVLWKSSSIAGAAYNCSWYDLTPKDAALLIIMMKRSSKTLQVTAGNFCVFSMQLYAQICKTSGGYLSMLLAVKDRIS